MVRLGCSKEMPRMTLDALELSVLKMNVSNGIRCM